MHSFHRQIGDMRPEPLPLRPVTTTIGATPQLIKVDKAVQITVSPPKGSSGLKAPIREERPAAVITAPL